MQLKDRPDKARRKIEKQGKSKGKGKEMYFDEPVRLKAFSRIEYSEEKQAVMTNIQ